VYSIEKAALYGFDRVESYVRFELIGSAIAIALTIMVVLLGWNAYLMPLTVGYSVLILGAWLRLRRGPGASARSLGGSGKGERVAVPRAEKREIAGYVGMASLGGLAAAGLLQALPLLADIYTTPQEVAYFVTAVSLVAPLYFLPRALGMALFPAMAHAHGAGDLQAVRRQADLSTRALFVVLAPLFVVAIMLARPILTLVYKPEFASGDVVLQVILAATYLMVTQVPAVNSLSSGSPREVRIPVSSAVACWFTGMLAAIPLGLTLGDVGVGLAYLLAAAVAAAWPVIAVARRHELAWRGPLGRSLAVVAAGLLAAQALPDGWLVDVSASLIAGAIAVALLYRDFRRILRDSGYGA
jgi:O-antigen/teichoic acid export membrane protein